MSINDLGDETTALLPSSNSSSRRPSEHGNDSNKPRLILRPVLICILLLDFLTMFGYYQVLAPKFRLVELTICRSYYQEHDPSVIIPRPSWLGYEIDERKCKLSRIQQDVSNLRSWGVLFDSLCTFLLSVPYGILADRYGRKLGYALCIVGLLLSNVWFLLVCTYTDKFPVTAVLASSAFLAIGGGSSVMLAMTTTMGVDVAEKEQRSTVLYWLLSVYYLGYVSGTGLAPITMQIPWLPYLLTFLSWAMALFITIFMPQTEPVKENSKLNSPNNNELENQTSQLVEHSMIDSVSKKFWEAYSYLKRHKKLLGIIAVCPLVQTRSPLAELILPYVSTRYGWSIGQAGTLDAMNGALSLLLGALILPRIVQTLRRGPYTAIQADWKIALYSTNALFIGALVVGLAPQVGFMIIGWAIFSTGFGARMSVLSVATSFVTPQQVARLTTIILTLETITDLTCSPLIWRLWSAGLALEGTGLGLPWFVVSLAMFLASIIVWSITFPSKETQSPSESNL